MSELKVNKLSPESGTTLTLGDVGDTIVNNGTASGFLPTAGSSGNVMTSDGTNWASTAPAAGGAWEKITETTSTYANEFAFTSLTSHTYYEIRFNGVYTGYNAQNLVAQVSTNNGSSYESGTDYFYNMRHYSSATATNHLHDGVASFMRFQGNTSDAYPYRTISGRIWFDNIGNTNAPKIFNFQTGMFRATPNNIEVTNGVMGWKNTTAVNAIKIYASAGNITGNFTLFGAV